MKKLLNIAIAITVIFYFTGCENQTDTEFYEASSLDSFEGKTNIANHHEGKMVTVGFNILFIGNYQQPSEEHTNICNSFSTPESPIVPVKNTGEGRGTHFKKLTSFFEFCVRPNFDEGGGTYPEGYLVAHFTDEDGDQLDINIASGVVVTGRLPGMPSYATSYFRDKFMIIGGTGKFEGATGEGYTNDYNFINHDGIQQTSHHWQGKITMKKGKK